MENSKDSFYKLQNPNEEVQYEQLVRIPTSQDGSHQAQNPTSLIESFIEKKYGEVMNLQSYLINELQYIQNCKERNKNIEKFIVSNVLPSLSEFKKSLQGLRSFVKLICGLAVNYVEAVGEKSKNILMQKQDKCVRYEVQIKNLRKQIQQLKFCKYQIQNKKLSQQSQKCKIIQLSKQEYAQQSSSKSPIFQRQYNHYTNCKKEQKSHERDLSKNIQESRSSLNKNSARKTKDQAEGNIRLQQGSLSGNCTSSSKLNKYQQCYKNILSNKKVSISYKCQKSPLKKTNTDDANNSKSPKKIEIDRKVAKNQPQNQLQDRKQYIKQKIQKIKIKAQCRQIHKNTIPKDRIR